MQQKIKILSSVPEVVYHGSTTEHQQSLNIIRTDVSRYDLDFGQGFYTTSVKKQAVEWARGKSSSLYKPLILTYKINFDIIESLGGIIYKNPNEEWARLIYDNRLGRTRHVKNIDYIYGHLADGIMFAFYWKRLKMALRILMISKGR